VKNTAQPLILLAVAACGPVDIAITTTGGSGYPPDAGSTTDLDGGTATTDHGDGSTGSGSSSGEPGSDGVASGEGSGSTGGSTGGPACVVVALDHACVCNGAVVPPEPYIVPGGVECACGDEVVECPACTLLDAGCYCADVLSNLLYCGCFVDATGQWICDW
jgi:hypothetical protein